MSAPYGYCPICGAPGVQRERRINGDDECANGHKYPSRSALASPPAPKSTNPNSASLGQCPLCRANDYLREKRTNGNDECVNGHKYPSQLTKATVPVVSRTGWREGNWLPREFYSPLGAITGPLQPVFLLDPPSEHDYVWLAVYFDGVNPKEGYGPYRHPLRSGDVIQMLSLLASMPAAPTKFRWRWLPLKVPSLD